MAGSFRPSRANFQPMPPCGLAGAPKQNGRKLQTGRVRRAKHLQRCWRLVNRFRGHKPAFRRRQRARTASLSAPDSIAAKPVKPCDGGVSGALNLLLFLQWNPGRRQRLRPGLGGFSNRAMAASHATARHMRNRAGGPYNPALFASCNAQLAGFLLLPCRFTPTNAAAAALPRMCCKKCLMRR